MRALRNVAVLTGLLASVGAALAWFASLTEDEVRRNRLAAETRVLSDLAGVSVDAGPGDDQLLCERGLAILHGAGRGYGGEFRLAVAIRTGQGRGTVAGVRIIEHAETPGFSDILDAGAAWLDSFRAGRVDAVTGATVTSQAVINAVERTTARFEREVVCL